MDIRLDGKVAIVTGGSRGIGRGIAAAMAEAGAKVMITSRNEETCAATVEDLRASTGGDLAWVPATWEKSRTCNGCWTAPWRRLGPSMY